MQPKSNPARGRWAFAAANPAVTYVLIALNVLVFGYTAWQSHDLLANYRDSSLFLRWVMFPPAVASGDWVRVVGSGFLHYGPIHLGLNMLALYVVGKEVERFLGAGRYVGVYVVSLLGGSAAVMVGSPHTATAGASGAIYGLFGAITVILVWLRLNPTTMLGIIAINVMFSISLPGISLWAHLGGLAAGTLATMGVVFVPRWLRLRDAFTASALGWVALAVVAVVEVLVIATVRVAG